MTMTNKVGSPFGRTNPLKYTLHQLPVGTGNTSTEESKLHSWIQYKSF